MQKAFMLFFLLAITVFGCQNANTSSSQSENSQEKVYITLAVDGMTCTGCENTVQKALIGMEGVDSAFASHTNKSVRILVDTSAVSVKEMQQIIEKKGYTAGNILD